MQQKLKHFVSRSVNEIGFRDDNDVLPSPSSERPPVSWVSVDVTWNIRSDLIPSIFGSLLHVGGHRHVEA